jgi:hypothetical protein
MMMSKRLNSQFMQKRTQFQQGVIPGGSFADIQS